MQSKKEKLEEQLHEYISSVLSIAESRDELDYFDISISNHNGDLQRKYTAKDRKKVY